MSEYPSIRDILLTFNMEIRVPNFSSALLCFGTSITAVEPSAVRSSSYNAYLEPTYAEGSSIRTIHTPVSDRTFTCLNLHSSTTRYCSRLQAAGCSQRAIQARIYTQQVIGPEQRSSQPT